MGIELDYKPAGPTLVRFHKSDQRRRLVMGPVGSGKSVCGCWETMLRAYAMPPCQDGVRRSRYAIIRNTFGDLERTTIKTWVDQFGDAFGKPVTRKAGIIHEVKRILEDGTRLEIEVMFFSMDREQDVKRLLSLELSGAFVNEAREIPKPIFAALDDRVTRYPSKDMLGAGVVPFFGWWADTNPPDTDGWIYETFEVERPKNWKMFRQPGGVIWNGHEWVFNPKAENIDNLTLGSRYYTDALAGKGDDHIRVYYAAEYGYVKEGRLVIGDFSESLHVSQVDLEFDEKIETIYVGMDFGATPAAALMQLKPNGAWHVIEEHQAEKTGVGPFAEDILRPRLVELASRGFQFVITGDPAGSSTDQGDGNTPFKVLAGHQIKCHPAYTNSFDHRCEVLRRLCRQVVEGRPKFLLSRQCKISRRGLAQKYVFKKVGVSTDEGQKYQTIPDKNEFSHIVDAIIYGMMGSGEGRNLGGVGRSSGRLPYRKLN